MVKAKKKKRVKKKVSQNMFVKGGMTMLIWGGVFGVFYHVLYLLIMVETYAGEVSHTLLWNVLKELGILLLLCGLIFVCYSILKEKERGGFFRKNAGSFLISGALLSFPAVFYALYELISTISEPTTRHFVMSIFPSLMEHFARLYLFAGVVFLGIFFWEYRNKRKWAAELLIGGVIAECVAVVISSYGIYDTYQFFLGTYGEASKDLIISQFLVPGFLNNISILFVIMGILCFSASYLWKVYDFRTWAGRTLTLGGIVGAFHGFIRLGIDSQSIQSEITQVRQSIMNLTPYSTVLEDLPLTVETLREFYVKKMIPLYFEHALWVLVYTGIALAGIYLWTRK